ncbi:Proliferating cell nuclear antigen PCNA [Neofusicoccum parvum]|uniref:Proliferating cell nuclear antigen PCNA n=1 Tax=Neofusicoccum parvum TaxID=310453 RepID=A0ACB5RY31_9PEZI|nr:Proliferating cell nuclear antigen PCNA [Neofusicoccum parvum]GME30964.1 Proliferating cell nuclear antigen PCNA [Neofusicoccum parvum]
MENIIYEDSPLAAYLEGEGTGEPGWVASVEDDKSDRSEKSEQSQAASFAPRGPSTLQSKLRKKLPRPLKLPHRGSIHRIQSAYSRAVNSRLGRADNTRFLEHFRFTIISSQLLSEHSGQTAFKVPSGPADGATQAIEYKGGSINVTGAAATGVGAFVVVSLLHWARESRQGGGGFNKGRLFVVVMATAVGLTVAYAHAKRQWLQNLRHRAVAAASALVSNLQAFDTSASSALMLIQEVELVSRGYRLSTPMPPITRLDEKGQIKRCARLRRSLRSAFAATLPAFADECATMRTLVEPDDLERYLDVYDITSQDMQEAALGYSEDEFEDGETLKALRIWQFRLITLRRIFLSSLLALEADGDKEDFARWRPTIDAMERLTELSGKWCEKLTRILGEEEQFAMPSPQPKAPLTPGKEKMRASVRQMSALSQGIRGLQAKMQILREESNKSLEESAEVTELGSTLMAQYDSIGADLKNLVQAWEAGKTSLALNIDRQERRISQASSSGGLRSPVPSLGGLTVVDESGSPSDALRALNGEFPPFNNRNSGSSVASNSGSDEEIFEAIAMPRTRMSMTREERMAKIQEDRVRQATLREQRDQNTNMLRELESVISLRPGPKKPRPATYGGRVSSY